MWIVYGIIAGILVGGYTSQLIELFTDLHLGYIKNRREFWMRLIPFYNTYKMIKDLED